MATSRRAKIISVGGGKGGVGKSVVASNLGVAMAQEGARVVLVDGDLGAPNLHTLFGLPRLPRTIQDFLERSIDSLEMARASTGVPNLTLVPGRAAVVGAANIHSSHKLRLIRHIRDLEADVVVVDVGAGVSFNVLDLFDTGDLRLTVMLPQLTSVENGYAFLKGAVFRELRRVAAQRRQAALIDDSQEARESTRTVAQLLSRLRQEDAALAAALEGGLARFGARIVGNQVFEPKEANVLFAISRMARDFLGLEAPVLGILRASRKVHDSIGSSRPFLLDETGEESALAVRRIARALLQEQVTQLRDQREALEQDEDRVEAAPEAKPEEAGPLPTTLARYERAYERRAIDCQGVLIFAGASVTVRVRDISYGGALVEMDRPPAPGARAVLIFTELEGRPSVPCAVRHSSAEQRRAGIEFRVEQQAARQLADSVARRFPPSPLAEERRHP
jgi:flagellar biosynthesis protein FlhG